MTKIEVTRAFCIGGIPQQIGAQISVEKALAQELIHMNKATLVPAVVEAPAAEAVTESKTAPRAERKEKTK